MSKWCTGDFFCQFLHRFMGYLGRGLDVETLGRSHVLVPRDALNRRVFDAQLLEVGREALLLEGPAGSGKTQLAVAVASAANTHIERLQCYRGVTEDKAIVRFDESLQRLYMEFSRGQHESWHGLQANSKGRDFFRPGPLMRAFECMRPCVLLIDELDKVDDGFEAMLLGSSRRLHLRPEFESTIRMPEEVTSVIFGSPVTFTAEHSEAEPDYIYVKPISQRAAQSNLLIATKSGQQVTLELINDGDTEINPTQPVDFLIQYRAARNFLVSSDVPAPVAPAGAAREEAAGTSLRSANAVSSALQLEFEQQQTINAPHWTKWAGKQIETSIGDVRQWSNDTVISYSVLNSSDQAVEIVPPQIQITSRQTRKKRNKDGKGIIADQLEICEYKLSTTRLELGGRADGIVVFDCPNFQQSTATEPMRFVIAYTAKICEPNTTWPPK